jgi:hypothetical protein
MERRTAKTLALRVTHIAPPGLCAGRTVDQYGVRRPTAPLARELVRYTVAGGLASLVDVGVLVVLTSSLGVYYLHAAALAFSVGLPPAMGSVLRGCFRRAPGRIPGWSSGSLRSLAG